MSKRKDFIVGEALWQLEKAYGETPTDDEVSAWADSIFMERMSEAEVAEIRARLSTEHDEEIEG